MSEEQVQAAQVLAKEPTTGSVAEPQIPQPVVVEPLKEAPKPEEKESARFLALSKKEREIVRRQEEVRLAKKDIENKYKAVEEWNKIIREAKLNPKKALEAMGLTYNDLSEYYLNDEQPTATLQVKHLEDKLTAFEQQQLDYKKEQERKIEVEKAQYLEEFGQEIKGFIDTNKDKYELTASDPRWSEEVKNVIALNYQQTGKVLSIEEGTKLVEDYLEKEVEKYTATKKWQAKVNPPKPAQEPGQPIKGEPSKIQSAAKSRVTLDNSLNPRPANHDVVFPQNDFSDEARLKRALRAMENKI